MEGSDKATAECPFNRTFFFRLRGLPDIVAVNGHVADDISVVQPQVKYAQLPHLFRNKGRNNF